MFPSLPLLSCKLSVSVKKTLIEKKIIHLIIRDWKFTTVMAITRLSTVNDNITKTSQKIGRWNWCHITKRIHETSYSKGYRFLAISQCKITSYVQKLKTLNVILDSDSGLLFSLVSLHHITWDLICYHLNRIMNKGKQ